MTRSDSLFQRFENMNLNAISSQTLKKINQEQLDELKRREMKISGAFNALRDMFDD